MAETLYAAFANADDAERAAGALLDYGMQDQDVTLLSGRHGTDAEPREPIASKAEPNREPWGAPGDVHTGDDAYFAQGRVGQREIESVERQPTGTGTTLGSTVSARRAATVEDVDEEDELMGVVPATPDPMAANLMPPTTVLTPADTRMNEAEEAEVDAKSGLSVTTPEDAESGAVKGVAIGAGVGILAALASLWVPGVGLILGGGALADAIGGAVLTAGAGAIAGGATGYLKDQGVSPEHVRHYEETVRGGGAMVAVHVPSGEVTAEKAREILTKYNGSHITSTPVAAA